MCGLIWPTFCLLMMVVSFEIFLFSSAAPFNPRWPATRKPNKEENSWWTSMKPSSKKELISTMITSESPSRDSNDYIPRLVSLPSTYNSEKRIDDDSVVDDDTYLRNSMKESSSSTFLMNNSSSQKKEKEIIQMKPEPISAKNIGRFWWKKKLSPQSDRSQINRYLI